MDKTTFSVLAVSAALAAVAVAVADDYTTQPPASANATNETYVSIITGIPWKPNHRITLEQYKERDQKMLRHTGGFIYFEAEGPNVLFVEARGKAALTLKEVARLWNLGSKLEADISEESLNGEDPLDHARKVIERRKPLMVLEVVEDDRLPALSVFPEERIGIVNASKLKGQSNDPAATEMRVMKEVWRALGFIGGLGYSSVDNDVMQPWYTLADLDSTDNAYIQPMSMMGMQRMWDKFGVKRPRKVSYRTAVKQGWAPAPTNDYQKAVWEEVKAWQATNATEKASLSPVK